MALVLACGSGALIGLGCEPTLIVGEWSCSAEQKSDATSALDFPTPEDPVAIPWKTSFEEGFCDYLGPTSFCYANSAASSELVDSPVHSGRKAASYTITGQQNDGLQARCVRQGELPRAAYYGAWFYIPSEVTASDTWNLFHFEGREPSDPQPEDQHGLWDVSVRVATDGSLRVYVYDFLRGATIQDLDSNEIPVGQWFHLETYFERASDASGRFSVYVSGQLALDLSDLATDDATLGQWYVGNFAAAITPSVNTLIVDDVTIDTERQGVE